MTGSAMTITVDSRQVEEMLARAPVATKRRLRELVERGAIDIQREMRIAANVAVTGDLRRSVRYTFNTATLSAVIEPTAKYAAAVENGSRPHFVSARPGTPLSRWAISKGINPYAVAKSIAKKGTKPHPFVQPTFNKMKPQVERYIERGVAQLAQEMNDGRL